MDTPEEVHVFVDLIVDESVRRLDERIDSLCKDCPLKSVPINPEP